MLLSKPVSLLFAATAVAGPVDNYKRDNSSTVWNTTRCSDDELDIVKEWTNMTPTEKEAYIAAEKCLWELDSTSGLTGATTRFEDLVALHQNMTPTIHAVVSTDHLAHDQTY